ncbi:MAG TPA: biopolymer transporter ExbD [Sandaracinaceae bacterium LLY-WYZ-13_1]|nr:biopolymer transporter ExbD [Sandaracinaceae bacterium LLY-WYZ-13_1]
MNFRRRRGRAEPRIEITPLIDVIFQLLIFFLLTTRFITERSLDVELPVADAEASARDRRTVLVLDVRRDGRVFHEGQRVEGTALDRILRRTVRGAARPVLLLRADREVDHGRVVDVMDRARAHGLTELAIGTRPREPGQ